MRWRDVLCAGWMLCTATNALAIDDLDRKSALVAWSLSQELGRRQAATLTMAAWATLTTDADDSAALAGEWQRAFDHVSWLDQQRPDITGPALPLGRGALSSVFLATLPAQEPSYRSQQPLTAGSHSYALLDLVVRGDDERQAQAFLDAAILWAADNGDLVWREVIDVDSPATMVVKEALQPWLVLPLAASLSDWGKALGHGHMLGTEAYLLALQQQEPVGASILVAEREDAERWLADSIRAIERSRRADQASLRALMEIAYAVELMVLGLVDPSAPLANVVRAEIDARITQGQWSTTDETIAEDLSGLATAIEALQAGNAVSARRDYAAAVARLGRLSGQLLDYRRQPLREGFITDQLACVGLARTPGGLPQEPITEQQYRGCLQAFARWGTEASLEPVMAGSMQLPADQEPLNRELSLEPWQRLNMLRALVRETLGLSCIADRPLANALEWAESATAFAWFADQWPSFFDDSVELQRDLDRLIETGQSVARTLSVEFDCGENHGAIMRTALGDYHQALQRLDQAAAAVRQRFLTERLAPEADLDLAGSPNQVTRYQPSSRGVPPCGGTPSCGVNAELPASRALFGLFPQSYLIAEQLGLTELELCYTNVQWVDRRSLPSDVTNRAMASYYGKLSFELVGAAAGDRNALFVHRLTDLDEHLYLYGENAPEVLDEGCPEARIGTRVVSQLPAQTFELVPRRLTYMTAARESPAQLLSRSWDQGPEWRDWFVTAREVETVLAADHQFDAVLIAERMRELDRELNTLLYASLQGQATGLNWPELSLVTQAVQSLQQTLLVVRQLAHVYTPVLLQTDDAWRAALFGSHGLLDADAIGRAYARVSAAELLSKALGDALQITAYIDSETSRMRRPQFPRFILQALLELHALRASVAKAR